MKPSLRARRGQPCLLQPNPGLKHVGGQWARAMVLVLSVAAGVPTAWAQGGRTSVIHGIVTDDTDAADARRHRDLVEPGRCRLKQRVAVTDGDGSYRFASYRRGTFRVDLRAPGFNRFVRDELRLTIGFTARVDATMAVGG